MEFTNYTWQEIELFIKQGYIAILPVGCTEQQGPHLTVNWDNLFVENLCSQSSSYAEEKYSVKSLVLPTVPFGPTDEHMHWPGFLNVSVKTHNLVVFELMESLSKQGFTKIVVWSGCGGHNLKPSVNKFNSSFKGMAKAYLPHIDCYNIAVESDGREIANDGGHADAVSTSWCMYLSPKDVRSEKFDSSYNKPVDWSNPISDFSNYTKSGSLGDIRNANIEFGKKSWKLLIEKCSGVLNEVYNDTV